MDGWMDREEILLRDFFLKIKKFIELKSSEESVWNRVYYPSAYHTRKEGG